jgi:hypothetical protein
LFHSFDTLNPNPEHWPLTLKTLFVIRHVFHFESRNSPTPLPTIPQARTGGRGEEQSAGADLRTGQGAFNERNQPPPPPRPAVPPAAAPVRDAPARACRRRSKRSRKRSRQGTTRSLYTRRPSPESRACQHQKQPHPPLPPSSAIRTHIVPHSSLADWAAGASADGAGAPSLRPRCRRARAASRWNTEGLRWVTLQTPPPPSSPITGTNRTRIISPPGTNRTRISPRPVRIGRAVFLSGPAGWENCARNV